MPGSHALILCLRACRRRTHQNLIQILNDPSLNIGEDPGEPYIYDFPGLSDKEIGMDKLQAFMQVCCGELSACHTIP